MAHSSSPVRSLSWFSLILCVACSSACRSKQSSRGGDPDEINLSQNVTVKSKPQDVVFKDFENNWRKFISPSPLLAMPVVGTVQQRENAPQPIITPECLYVQSADGYVPRITITWNGEPAVMAKARVKEANATASGQEQAPEMRLDLALHHDAFARNYYSSVLSTDVNQRFNLPSNSGLVKDPEAVRLTGPGLFPQLLEFRTQLLHDTANNRQVARNTVVIQELSEGLTYQMRVSHRTGNQWTADQQFIFVTPVCQTSF
jgi:hypothetical protein